MMSVLFWTCACGIVYSYFGYPAVLALMGRLRRRAERPAHASATNRLPSVTLLIPVHNESAIIERKMENTLRLDYRGGLEVVVVSDGSTDGTVGEIRRFLSDSRLRLIELAPRKGKANALNEGIRAATGDIVVFSDASIMLDRDALTNIVAPFADPTIGCASGEDLIENAGGEGLYGRYELFLRNLESQLGSIVGASGSFYAQRRSLVGSFPEGVAPDFLSVLTTVEKGYRAVSVPSAVGYMTAVSSAKDEFSRKVRTIIRGMTALFSRKTLLNPARFPMFAFFLLSHKVMRWSVPVCMVGALISNAFLAPIGTFYQVTLAAQLIFYMAALLAYAGVKRIANTAWGRVTLYFTIVNLAILYSWLLYLLGRRLEVWSPTNRSG